MAYDIPKWLNTVALVMHEMRNSTLIVRDDTNTERAFTPEEHVIFERWIEQSEQISREADAILKDWTALPGEKG